MEDNRNTNNDDSLRDLAVDGFDDIGDGDDSVIDAMSEHDEADVCDVGISEMTDDFNQGVDLDDVDGDLFTDDDIFDEDTDDAGDDFDPDDDFDLNDDELPDCEDYDEDYDAEAVDCTGEDQ